MIDYDYQITLRQTSDTSPKQGAFVAHLSDVFIIQDGQRIETSCPTADFPADTRVDAILKANQAFNAWLDLTIKEQN